MARNSKRSPRRKASLVEAGDALLVYSGREAFVRSATTIRRVDHPRPGLHVSCARFIRDRDVAVLGWDMHDAMPDTDGLPWPVHGVLYSYGVALLDNALLEPLARACADQRRYEFMFMALPLKMLADGKPGQSDCDVLVEGAGCWRISRPWSSTSTAPCLTVVLASSGLFEINGTGWLNSSRLSTRNSTCRLLSRVIAMVMRHGRSCLPAWSRSSSFRLACPRRC